MMALHIKKFATLLCPLLYGIVPLKAISVNMLWYLVYIVFASEEKSSLCIKGTQLQIAFSEVIFATALMVVYVRPIRLNDHMVCQWATCSR